MAITITKCSYRRGTDLLDNNNDFLTVEARVGADCLKVNIVLKPLLTPILTLQPTGGTVSVSNQSVGTVRMDGVTEVCVQCVSDGSVVEEACCKPVRSNPPAGVTPPPAPVPPAPAPKDEKKCFITTAVLGSEMHPEVRLLHRLRDDVIRQTRWGDQFFREYFEIYHRVSPEIAARIEEHPETREVLRWSVIRPWLNYLHLMLQRPHTWRLEGVDPELRAYLERMKSDMDAWLAQIPLPESFEGMQPLDVARELVLILHLVLRGREAAYVDQLTRQSVLPLRLSEQELADLRLFSKELSLPVSLLDQVVATREPV